MKFANAIKIHRKSGVRFGERGAPVRFPLDQLSTCKVTDEGLPITSDPVMYVYGCRCKAVVSHISRKTSEIWGTRPYCLIEQYG
jgi:hypothetical protein